MNNKSKTINQIILIIEYSLVVIYPFLHIFFIRRKDDDGVFYSTILGILTILSIFHLCKKYIKKKYNEDVKHYQQHSYKIYGTFISGLYFVLIYIISIAIAKWNITS